MLNPSGATCVRLEPGEYTVTAADITGEGIVGGCGSTPQQLENDVALFRVKGSSSGADRTFDFTGVTIKVPVELLSEAENATRGETRLLKNEQGATVWMIEGSEITFVNGTFETTYPDEADYVDENGEIDDYEAYNRAFKERSLMPGSSFPQFTLKGHDITFNGTTISVRGSYPYGYGDMYGKSDDNALSALVRKQSGVLITGDCNRMLDVTVDLAALGHGIFMQGNSDCTRIEDSKVLGRVRLGADMLTEGPTSTAANFCYQTYHSSWDRGQLIEYDRYYTLTEDGIRNYSDTHDDPENAASPELTSRSVLVKNTIVHRVRGAIATALSAGDVLIKDVDVRQSEIGYSLPSDGVIFRSTGDATVGPLLDLLYENKSNAKVDLRLVDLGEPFGDHPFAQVTGTGHEISVGGARPEWANEHPIKIGYASERYTACRDEYRHQAEGIQLVSSTKVPVELTAHAEGSAVWATTMNDDGVSNQLRQASEWTFHQQGSNSNHAQVQFWHLGWEDNDDHPWSGMPNGPCLFHLGSLVLGFADCQTSAYESRYWKFESGKMKYSIDLGFAGGACLGIDGNDDAYFADCTTVTKTWTRRTDGKIQWDADGPEDMPGGSCLGYLGSSDFGLTPCGASALTSDCRNTGCEASALDAAPQSPVLPEDPYDVDGDSDPSPCTPGWNQQHWEPIASGANHVLKWRMVQKRWTLPNGVEEEIKGLGPYLRYDTTAGLIFGEWPDTTAAPDGTPWTMEVLSTEAHVDSAHVDQYVRFKNTSNSAQCFQYLGSGAFGLAACSNGKRWKLRADGQLEWASHPGNEAWSGDKAGHCLHYLGAEPGSAVSGCPTPIPATFGLVSCGNRQRRYDVCFDADPNADCASNGWY